MEKVIRVLFVCLLVVFPIGQIGRVELGGGVALLLNDLIVFLVAGSWLLVKIQRRSFPKNELTIPITTFAGVALFSLLLRVGSLPANQFFVSSLYLIRWVAYAALFFVVSDFEETFKKKVPYGLMFAGFATAILGFIQYFLYPNLRNLFYAGWDEHLYRLFSSFLDPNFAGGIFVLSLTISISYMFQLQKGTPFKDRIIFGLGAIISFIALLLTYSRGSFVSFAAAMLALLFLSNQKKLLIAFLFIFTIGVFLLPKDLQSEGVRLLRTASITARVESVQQALTIFQENPLFGVGFNAYRYAQRERGFLDEKDWEQVHSGAGTDNSFLFVLATTGIVGFVAYLFMWIRVIRESWGNSLFLASLFALFAHALFANSLFYPWIMEWLWILLAASKAQKLP